MIAAGIDSSIRMDDIEHGKDVLGLSSRNTSDSHKGRRVLEIYSSMMESMRD